MAPPGDRPGSDASWTPPAGSRPGLAAPEDTVRDICGHQRGRSRHWAGGAISAAQPPTLVPRTPRREGPSVSHAAGTLLHRSLAPRVTRDSCLFCTSPPRGLTQALVNGPRSFGPCGLSSQLSV